MRNRMYGGVRGRKTKVGEKLLCFPPTRFCVCRFLPMLDKDSQMLRYLPLNAFFTVKAVTATSTE